MAVMGTHDGELNAKIIAVRNFGNVISVYRFLYRAIFTIVCINLSLSEALFFVILDSSEEKFSSQEFSPVKKINPCKSECQTDKK